MILLKIVAWLAIAYLTLKLIGVTLKWYLARRLQRFMHDQGEKMKSAFEQTGQTARPAAVQEAMIRCAHCGTFVPRQQSFLEKGLSFCSTEHGQDFHAERG